MGKIQAEKKMILISKIRNEIERKNDLEMRFGNDN